MNEIQETMTSEPTCCTREMSLQEVAQLMRDCDCGMLPVVESEQSKRPIGAITDRDIVCRILAEGKNPLECRAEDAMTRDCITLSEESSFEEALEVMEEHQIRRLIIVDEDQVITGVLSQADIARFNRDMAAEVVEKVSQPSGRPA